MRMSAKRPLGRAERLHRGHEARDLALGVRSGGGIGVGDLWFDRQPATTLS